MYIILLIALVSTFNVLVSTKGQEGLVGIPAIIWKSNQNELSSVNNNNNADKQDQYFGLEKNGVTQYDVIRLFDNLCELGESKIESKSLLSAASSFSKVKGDYKKVTAAVLYMAEELGSEQVKSRNLKFVEKISNMNNGLVLPYTFFPETSKNNGEEDKPNFVPKAGLPWKEWFLNQKNQIYQKSQNFEAKLKEKIQEKEFLAIFVSLDLDDNWDQTIQETDALIKKYTSSFVSILTGLNHASPSKVISSPSNIYEDFLIQQSRRLADTSNETANLITLKTHSATMTSDIFLGMILSLLLFLAVLQYLFCLDLIQGPTMYVKSYPVRGKVFE